LIEPRVSLLSLPFALWNAWAVMQLIKVVVNYRGSKRWVFK
jgi:hypothetical protein